MKRKLFLLLCALLTMIGVQAQGWTDVTSTYITNASFESDGNSAASNANLTITGWTETQSSAGSYNNTQTRDKDTDNASAFGAKITPADGTYYLFYRHGWNGDAGTTATFATTTSSIPAGVYCLKFRYQQSYSEDSESKTTTRIKLAAKNGGSEIASVTTPNATKNSSFTDDGWQTSTFIFGIGEAAALDFEFTLYSGGQKRSDFLIDDVRLIKADNQTPVVDNTTDLYLYNEETGLYLSAGKSWGTHAIVDATGHPITANLSNGLYTLKTQEFDKYIGGLYMDAASANWLFLEAESGKYYLTQDGYNYMTSNGAGEEVINVTTPTAASVWTIVSKAARKTALSSATIENPTNATFLLPDPNFGRNNVAYSNWTWTFPDGENKNNAGNNDNFVVESYHKQFTFKTTLAAGTAPAGVYGVTAQGFYRQDGSDNEHLPVFYSNSEEQTFPLRTGSESSMNAASTSFSSGLYTIDPIYIRIENEDAFEVGAKLAGNTNLWCIWDNFQLKYYGDVTVAAVKMKASVDAYNAAMDEAKAFTESSMWAGDWTALQTAITENTVDLNDPDLTEEQLNTATANLVAANAAATTAVNSKTTYDNAVVLIDGGTNVNVTSLIINPSFESDGTGWTNNGMGFQTNDAFGKTGSKYAEAWQPNGTKSISQTISVLPAGIYQLSVRAKARGVTSAKIFANTNELALTIEDVENELNLTFDIDDRTAINLGFEGVGTGAGSSWLALDNFRLTFVGSIDDLTYTLATGKMDPDKAAAQTAAETAFLANKNLTTYNALLAAIAEAEASVANYAKLKAAIDKANDVREKNNFVTAAASTVFQAEIDKATNGWTNVTYSDAECNEETVALGTAVSGWHGNATGAAGIYMASTWGKTNENWWEAPYINTWSTEGDNDGSGFSVPFFEYFADANQNLPAKTMTATVEGLANGYYSVEVWARVQRRSDADFNADNSMITMSVNGGDATSIMSDTEHNVGSGGSVMRLGHYTAYGKVTDGTLTMSINVKLGSNVHWLSWRDVKYTYLGDAAANLKVNDGKLGTFIAPFDVTLPDNVKAYSATVVNNEVKLSKIDNDKLDAGTPVIVYGDGVSVDETFYGDANVTENQTVGNLVGILSESEKEVPAGAYVLQTQTIEEQQVQAFYKVATAAPGALNRCYLTSGSGNARLTIKFDDTTAINASEVQC